VSRSAVTKPGAAAAAALSLSPRFCSPAALLRRRPRQAAVLHYNKELCIAHARHEFLLVSAVAALDRRSWRRTLRRRTHRRATWPARSARAARLRLPQMTRPRPRARAAPSWTAARRPRRPRETSGRRRGWRARRAAAPRPRPPRPRARPSGAPPRQRCGAAAESAISVGWKLVAWSALVGLSSLCWWQACPRRPGRGCRGSQWEGPLLWLAGVARMAHVSQLMASQRPAIRRWPAGRPPRARRR